MPRVAIFGQDFCRMTSRKLAWGSKVICFVLSSTNSGQSGATVVRFLPQVTLDGFHSNQSMSLRHQLKKCSPRKFFAQYFEARRRPKLKQSCRHPQKDQTNRSGPADGHPWHSNQIRGLDFKLENLSTYSVQRVRLCEMPNSPQQGNLRLGSFRQKWLFYVRMTPLSHHVCYDGPQKQCSRCTAVRAAPAGMKIGSRSRPNIASFL